MANDNEAKRSNGNENVQKSAEDSTSHNEAEPLCEEKVEKSLSSSGSKIEATNSSEAKPSKGLLNDLVADLCISSSSNQQFGKSPVTSNNNGYGDYTNIRATTGFKTYQPETNNESTSSSSSTNQTTNASQAPVQNSSSSFSFKHFLNSSGSITAPSTTVTSLDPMIGLADSTSGGSSGSSSSHGNHLQTSTGARPKVPQSASICGQISSLVTGSNLQIPAAKIFKDQTASKMKRSPRFSSFDSQASLAEYAGGPNDFNPSSNNSNYNADNYNDSEETCDDYFNAASFSPRAPVSSSTNKSNDYDSCQYLPRSYSNYELPTGTPRRRMGYSPSNRPNRLALNYNAGNLPNAQVEFDLPTTSAAASASGSSGLGPLGNAASMRQPGSNMNELPHGAAVLPDFVQDHWLDSWYAHDMHLNSPPNSPISDFVDEMHLSRCLDASNSRSSAQSTSKRENLSADGNTSGGNNLLGSSLGMSGNNGSMVGSGNLLNDSSVSSTMLPDFLSDGPIIHSSQRIADVAVGLPSNSMGSPDESAMVTQLSRVLSENERLQRELNEVRTSLSEQTRRANDLERQLHESLEKEKATSTEKHTPSEAPEGSIVSKLKSQIASMKNEIERLRRENELLKEGGAIGGFEDADNIASTSKKTQQSKPSRSQNIARDLRLAASTAENHLRQLLTGVENLRQIATMISDNSSRQDYDDLYPGYQDDCFNYDDYDDQAP